ncbi:MAG: phosphatase PAP2 family protein [Proteobacteria bacterium]|nr:phosphatase PAP2 family protein [Pseudomonadota bacterium]
MLLRAIALESLLEWDRRWSRRLNASVDIVPVRILFRLASRLGDGVFWYSVMLALSIALGRTGVETALRMLAAGAIGLGIYKLLKVRTGRPRPYKVLGGIRPGMAPLDAYSFPSGHTLHAVAFTLVAVSNVPAIAWILVPFTALVAISRVVLGLHYPSDVLAGAAIGACVAQGVLAL